MSSPLDDAGRPHPNGPLTLEMLRRDIAEALYLDISEVGDDDDLIDLGLDSVRLMSLTVRWNEAGAGVSFAELAVHADLAHWWKLIRSGMPLPER